MTEQELTTYVVGGLSGLVLMVATKLVEKAVGRRADRRAEHSVILAELESCRKELHTKTTELNDEVRRRRDAENKADVDVRAARAERDEAQEATRKVRDERDLAEEAGRLSRSEAQDAIGRMQGLYRKISEQERDVANLRSDLDTSNTARERLLEQNRILLEAWPLSRKPLPPLVRKDLEPGPD